MDDEIERTLLVKPEVFMYKIPPRASARGYRAADWNLTAPDWTGRLRCVARGKACELRLEDKTTGELFASCPVDKYPGTAVEAVTDSSRYFVVCLQVREGDQIHDCNNDHIAYLSRSQTSLQRNSICTQGLHFKFAWHALCIPPLHSCHHQFLADSHFAPNSY